MGICSYPSLCTICKTLNSEQPQAAKNDVKKPDLSLVPYTAVEACAQALMVGERKYGRYNYEKGHTTSQLVAAMLRHAFKYMSGEDNDPEDGQPHLGSVMACCAMLLEQKRLCTLKDNRSGKS